VVPRDFRARWITHTTKLENFIFDCCESHETRNEKDGACFVPGRIIGEARNAKAVSELDMLVFDLDRSSESEVERATAKIEAAGLFYYLYSTFNHESPETEVSYEDYEKFCLASLLDADCNEAARRFLLENKRYPESVVATARVIERMRNTNLGVMTVLGHEPMLKLRIIFILDRPYVRNYGMDEKGILTGRRENTTVGCDAQDVCARI
jgi:hypothetical protein